MRTVSAAPVGQKCAAESYYVKMPADSDDPGQGFQLKAATIPIEGGQYWPVGTFMGSQRW
jgi:hypothetical protein